MSLLLRDLVTSRLEVAGLAVEPDQGDRLVRYLALLARWNQRINLTSFDLGSPTDAAIDRLIVEPVMAARWVPGGEDVAVDIGSGGGSPAIPLKIVRPALRMALVEVRARKGAFLREVARELALSHLTVETMRFDAYCASPSAPTGRVGVVTMRAVRPDEEIWRDVKGLLRPGGRLLWFTEVGYKTNIGQTGLSLVSTDLPVLVLENWTS